MFANEQTGFPVGWGLEHEQDFLIGVASTAGDHRAAGGRLVTPDPSGQMRFLQSSGPVSTPSWSHEPPPRTCASLLLGFSIVPPALFLLRLTCSL